MEKPRARAGCGSVCRAGDGMLRRPENRQKQMANIDEELREISPQHSRVTGGSGLRCPLQGSAHCLLIRPIERLIGPARGGAGRRLGPAGADAAPVRMRQPRGPASCRSGPGRSAERGRGARRARRRSPPGCDGDSERAGGPPGGRGRAGARRCRVRSRPRIRHGATLPRIGPLWERKGKMRAGATGTTSAPGRQSISGAS
jgi:hypothetical protein